MAVEPRGCLPRLNRILRALSRPIFSPKSNQNGWSYIHITLFRKRGRIWKLQVRIWKLQVRGMAMRPRGCLPRLNRVLQALSGPI